MKDVNLNYVSEPRIRYPKMNTLFKRDKSTWKIIEGSYSKDEFLLIKKWLVTEKIDGTNVRIFYSYAYKYGSGEPNPIIEFRGRNDNSNMPRQLHEYLVNHFTKERMYDAFGESKVVLFGEGYGAGIQKGGAYRGDQRFILFDVYIDPWWLEYENVCDIAKKLEIPFVSSYGIMELDQIVDFVKGGVSSLTYFGNNCRAEGVIATSIPLLLFRNGYPLKFKLKCKDFD